MRPISTRRTTSMSRVWASERADVSGFASYGLQVAVASEFGIAGKHAVRVSCRSGPVCISVEDWPGVSRCARRGRDVRWQNVGSGCKGETDRNGGVIAGAKGIFRPCRRFGPGGACVLPGRAPGKRLSARLSGLVRGWPSGMDEQVQPQVYCLLPLPCFCGSDRTGSRWPDCALSGYRR